MRLITRIRAALTRKPAPAPLTEGQEWVKAFNDMDARSK